MEALAGCNPVAYGKWFDSTIPHEENPMKKQELRLKQKEGR